MDEIVAEAVRAHKKKTDWQLEQLQHSGVESAALSAKDKAAFTPPVSAAAASVS